MKQKRSSPATIFRPCTLSSRRSGRKQGKLKESNVECAPTFLQDTDDSAKWYPAGTAGFFYGAFCDLDTSQKYWQKPRYKHYKRTSKAQEMHQTAPGPQQPASASHVKKSRMVSISTATRSRPSAACRGDSTVAFHRDVGPGKSDCSA